MLWSILLTLEEKKKRDSKGTGLSEASYSWEGKPKTVFTQAAEETEKVQNKIGKI